MLDKHRHLRGNTARHLAETKSLQRLRKRCFGTFRYRPNASLSKRAPSTTRPSLRLKSITYERDKANCVRPPNVPRSLTGFSSIAAPSLLGEMADRVNPAELRMLEPASKLASETVC